VTSGLSLGEQAAPPGADPHLFGASGRDMMAALVAGERTPKVLAQ
jgi:hypothetical protein